jgi:hypothetical protein
MKTTTSGPAWVRFGYIYDVDGSPNVAAEFLCDKEAF